MRSPSLITACRYGMVRALSSLMISSSDDDTREEISAIRVLTTRAFVKTYKNVARIAVAVVSEPEILVTRLASTVRFGLTRLVVFKMVKCTFVTKFQTQLLPE